MRPVARRIEIGDAPEPWAALGVAPGVVGGVELVFTGAGGGIAALEVEGAPE